MARCSDRRRISFGAWILQRPLLLSALQRRSSCSPRWRAKRPPWRRTRRGYPSYANAPSSCAGKRCVEIRRMRKLKPSSNGKRTSAPKTLEHVIHGHGLRAPRQTLGEGHPSMANAPWGLQRDPHYRSNGTSHATPTTENQRTGTVFRQPWGIGSLPRKETLYEQRQRNQEPRD